jgi:L-asparaginase
MEYKEHQPKMQPRIVIHGGAGNIVRRNFPQEKYKAYREALLTIASFVFAALPPYTAPTNKQE